MAKPFLKWAGGKTQIIKEIERCLPNNLASKRFTYVEPFVGSGAVLFWMLDKFSNIKRAIVNDINADLISTYRVIASKPKELVSILEILQAEYHALDLQPDEKKVFYYSKRELFNSRLEDETAQAALLIFLNRTCFNGLYRVNRRNLFNVPIGSYRLPTICDTPNILAASQALSRVEILCGDFEDTMVLEEDAAFFYFDPPYKPLSETSSFNSYAKDEFGDGEQIRLRDFCKKVDQQGYKWLLSNSDPKSKDPNYNFFYDIYSDYEIVRVKARRSINSNPQRRGELNELLIKNY